MKKNKYIQIIPILVLFLISIIYLPYELKIKQTIWIILSLVLYFILSNLKLNKILKYSIIYYIIGILLLIFVLLTNNFTNGSRAWIDLGFIYIQPSEIIKIALILISIKYFDKINIFLLLLIYLIPMVLVFIEPDTGGVIIELLILIYFLIKKIDKKKILALLIALILLIGIIIGIYINNKELIINIIGPSIFYRIDRITSFLNDNSIQTTNAIVSIATGNTLYFPEMYNDFYIAYILSKNINIILIIVIFTIILLFMLKRKNTIGSNIVFYLILFQCWYNISMNLKIVPVIGIPYLFLSYGGSHIISSMILLGIINSNEDNKDNYNMDSPDLHIQA